MDNQKGFAGISFPFRFDGRGGLATSSTSVTDFSHIGESISQIVLTQLGERVMELEFGSETREHLFNMTEDETDIAILKYQVQEAIEKFEERVDVVNVEVLSNEDEVGEGTWVVEIEVFVKRYLKHQIFRIELS